MFAQQACLPVFSPSRFKYATSVPITKGAIWCVSTDTTYRYDTMDISVPVRAGMVRGVPDGVTRVTFSKFVTIEIQG